MRRIEPREYFDGEFCLPGDKSITHRAVMLNAGARGEAVIENASTGEDCLSTCDCMRNLGAKVELDGTTIRVHAVEEFLSGKELDCGNSGTTLRLLTGYLAGKGVETKLRGDASLSQRPMKRVSEPLALLGADIKTTEGHAPVYVAPRRLHGADVVLDVASAQVKSAVLLAGLSADGTTSVTEPIKSRDHTEKMLAAMGADICVAGNMVTVRRSVLQAVNVCVPADISSAAYFMALGALKGETLCKNVGINPTRTGILTAFDRLGVDYTLQNKRMSGGEETADILVKKSFMQGIELTEKDVPSMIDELPLIALMCAFADGESRITGAKELRVKESDRIRTTVELIKNLGGDCEELPDGFVIRGKKKLRGGDIDSHLDHRIAMTGVIGLLASEVGGSIYRPDCCTVSFPSFFEKLDEKSI